MALVVRKKPGTSEDQDFRTREYFDTSVENMLKLAAQVTVNVANIPTGNSVQTVIPVPGARADMGQTVQVGPPSTIHVGLVPWAYVSADDEVTLVLYNRAGSDIDPGEGVFGIRVMP